MSGIKENCRSTPINTITGFSLILTKSRLSRVRPIRNITRASMKITLSAAAEKISLKYIATADRIIAKAGKVRVLNVLCIE